MLLVDTSVWIGFLRGTDSEPVERLRSVLMSSEPVGITGVIYQEILQGADSVKRYEGYRDYFGSQPFFHPRDLVASYAEAARLFFLCRRNGVTIRSTADCLIAQIAIEHDLVLLHDDRDFDHMAQIVHELKVA
jgi:predicted nucleic acid-binding protein